MDKTKYKKIMKRLQEDYSYVTSLGYTVLGVFLQGSQNYELDYEGSDIDTKVILIPSFKDFIMNNKPVSTTLILPSNEHIDIKDIRLFIDCFKKQNINFIEILFTQYKVMNPEFEAFYQPMFDNAERIAHYNNYKAINSIAGMVYEKHKALCHPYPTLIEKIQKYGYDNKQLHHMMRCEEFMMRFINGTPYKDCLISKNKEHLINVKSEYIYKLEDAKALADTIEKVVKERKQHYMDTTALIIDHEMDSIMNDVLYNVLKHNFRREIIDE